jgi:hypothetical protein
LQKIKPQPLGWSSGKLAFLLWLTIIGTILSLPTIALALRVDQWTESAFGFGARTMDVSTQLALQALLAKVR